jgi:hypothetical protein
MLARYVTKKHVTIFPHTSACLAKIVCIRLISSLQTKTKAMIHFLNVKLEKGCIDCNKKYLMMCESIVLRSSNAPLFELD